MPRHAGHTFRRSSHREIPLNRCGSHIYRAFRQAFGNHHDMKEHAYFWQLFLARQNRPSAPIATYLINQELLRPPMNHEVDLAGSGPYVQAIIRGGQRGGCIRLASRPVQAGAPRIRSRRYGQEKEDPSAKTMEDAANGTAIDGQPIDAPVDGAPDSAASMDEIINGNGNGNGTAAANGTNGTNGTNGNGYGEKGIIGTYFSDMKEHPVALGSAFAVGWLLSRRI